MFRLSKTQQSHLGAASVGPFGGLGVFAFAVLERSLFDIAWPQQFLGGASLVWWVAGGEWYEESKRDWIICCPAFVQRGYGPYGGLGGEEIGFEKIGPELQLSEIQKNVVCQRNC